MTPDTAACARCGHIAEVHNHGCKFGIVEERCGCTAYVAAMTPDTAAWRTLAEAALQPLMPHMDFRQQVALDRARKDAARALCDAADEVDRLRKRLDTAWSRADADAPRLIAHAALVADLRALHVREVAQRQTGHGDNAEGIWLCAECLTEYPCRTAALLDRHAPTTGATP